MGIEQKGMRPLLRDIELCLIRWILGTPIFLNLGVPRKFQYYVAFADNNIMSHYSV